MSSLLPLVEAVDNFTYDGDDFYWSLVSSDGQPLGFLTPQIALRFEAEDSEDIIIMKAAKQVRLGNSLDTLERRTTLFNRIASNWKQFDVSLAHEWRDELYTVYYPKSKPFMLLERAFACLLGVVTYGVHITGYVPPSKTGDNVLKIWVPRRSMSKQTFPGKLDNTIAGGLAHPYSITENIIKECYEEGGLDEQFVNQNLVATGVLSYMFQPYGLKGHVQPEVEFIYDLVFDSESDHIPSPVDGEAENFKLMPIGEVYERILKEDFKPNCALVLIDFMIRHGFITWENEPNYLEIVSRIHRKLPFATMN